MGLVRRYSEINRSAKEEAANGDDQREKSWFMKNGPGVLLGDEDGNEEEERTRRTGPAIYVSISWRARVNSRHSQGNVEMRRRQCGRRSVEEKKGSTHCQPTRSNRSSSLSAITNCNSGSRTRCRGHGPRD
ncbi:hypothetical protein ALC62_00271 [Cyphomyrmex costatus]|uniref:Uncharacterized protein n=1 Tax=Cyphomyrmex costatus TaxID=456900 RepID=A0A195D7F2_9HYME|nr:hypothetical protein ALC62_00271 [Cyphomyrmex costatus]